MAEPLFEEGLFEEGLFEGDEGGVPALVNPFILYNARPGPFRLMWSNLIDTGIILTASSAALSVYNVRTMHRKRVWRTTSRLSQTLTIDLASTSRNLRCCALTGYNFTASATVALAYSDNGSSWTTLSQKTAQHDAVLFFFFSLRNNRYWRLTLNDPTNESPYLEVGRVFLGDYWEPSATIARNWAIKVLDRSEVKMSIGRQKWTNQKEIITQVSFQLPPLNEVDAIKNFLNIVRRIGLTNDIFLSLMPDAAAVYREVTGLYGRFVNITGVASISSFAYDTGSVVFEESF